MEPYTSPITRVRSPRVIQFDSGNEVKGFHTLMLSKAPIKVIGKNKYIVSDIHCALLTKRKIHYKIIDQ